MPPKGWRKDAQGNYPTTSYMKEQENITIDDLLFPRSVIVALARDVQQKTWEAAAAAAAANGSGAVPPEQKLLINKDAAMALQRSATIFVNHLLMFAREFSRENDKRTCTAEHVLQALEYIGFPGLKYAVQEKTNEWLVAQQLLKKLRGQDQTPVPADEGEAALQAESVAQPEAETTTETGAAETEDPAAKKARTEAAN